MSKRLTNKEHSLHIYNELHLNLPNYVSCSKLAKKLGVNYRTIRKCMKLLHENNLFKQPICEWHDEIFEK